MNPDKGEKFLLSEMSLSNTRHSLEELSGWLKKRNTEVRVNIEKTRFSKLSQWYFEEGTGNLRHDSGKFFSIEGVHVRTNFNRIRQWSQPIINQPEVGILGIIAKEFDGVLYFLMQAKIEPGNVNNVQLSPTLQATKSNYTTVHGGSRPTYLEYFLNRDRHQTLLDQLQSEQGSRFYKKRNRNIIIQVQEDIPDHPDFRWLTLAQIKKLSQLDDTVNMDTRTVVSGIGVTSLPRAGRHDLLPSGPEGAGTFPLEMLESCTSRTAHRSIEEILSWLAEIKTNYELETEKIPLNQVERWINTDHAIEHEENRFFRVIPVNVEIESREVKTWSQPLVQPLQDGICCFIVKKISGIYHFLVQAKVECGNMDIVELAPTVQCLTGGYKDGAIAKVPFLDYVLAADESRIRIDTRQSEEGGRFYRESNRNLIVEADDSFPEEIPASYLWMTLAQLKNFLMYNNFLNIQARSLISLISYT